MRRSSSHRTPHHRCGACSRPSRRPAPHPLSRIRSVPGRSRKRSKLRGPSGEFAIRRCSLAAKLEVSKPWARPESSTVIMAPNERRQHAGTVDDLAQDGADGQTGRGQPGDAVPQHLDLSNQFVATLQWPTLTGPCGTGS